MRAKDASQPNRAMPKDACRMLMDTERDLVGESTAYAGTDEAGRGCLAGPVVAAAVVLQGQADDWIGVNDSKQLSKRRREELFDTIHRQARGVGVGLATVEEIDTYNILQASRIAMGRAVLNLGLVLDVVLVDGPYAPVFSGQACRAIPVIDGDARCLSIAAASIVAKVYRDRWMARVAELYPGYGFDQHAGYGTKAHLEALRRLGPTPLHRTSFAPVRQLLQPGLGIL